MKLLRYGAIGAEKPGLLDATGTIRDLSGYIPAEAKTAARQQVRWCRHQESNPGPTDYKSILHADTFLENATAFPRALCPGAS